MGTLVSRRRPVDSAGASLDQATCYVVRLVDGGTRVEEARAHPRAPARVRVEYHFGSTIGVGYTNDISEGGLFLHCDDFATPGTRIYMELYLPGRLHPEALKIIGMVKRVQNEAGMGIHFEVAYARTRQLLQDFMHDLLDDERGMARRTHAPEVPVESAEAEIEATGVTWSGTSQLLIRFLLASVVVAIGAFVIVWLVDRMGVR